MLPVTEPVNTMIFDILKIPLKIYEQWSVYWLDARYIVQRLNDKFGPNCAIYDKSMKLGTIILDTIRVI